MKIAILIDSGCDIPDEPARAYRTGVIRLHIIYPEKDYTDGTDITAETIYQHFPREIPITSTPSPQDVREMLDEAKSEGYTHVLAFCISSGLSGTSSTAGHVPEEDTDLTSFVPDTRSISFGTDILAVWVAMRLGEGRTFDELKKILPRKVKDSKVFYYMDTSTYPRKDDRIGLVTSMVGSMPNIKSIISCDGDGVHYIITKTRDAKQGLTRLLEEARKSAGSSLCLIALFNGQRQDVTDALHPRLTTGIPNGILIMERVIIVSLIARTGPGLMGIGVLHL